MALLFAILVYDVVISNFSLSGTTVGTTGVKQLGHQFRNIVLRINVSDGVNDRVVRDEESGNSAAEGS